MGQQPDHRELTCPGVAVAIWEGGRCIPVPAVVSCRKGIVCSKGVQTGSWEAGVRCKMNGTAASWQQKLRGAEGLHAALLCGLLLCWPVQQADCENTAQQRYMCMEKAAVGKGRKQADEFRQS